MTSNYDVIVLGIGSMGAATCYYLARDGYKVLGLEQFSIPHEEGSHGGQSRITRKAYFEHADYVPLLSRAYENCRELEESTGHQLYFKTGLLYAGPSDHAVIQGVKNAASLFNIDLEKLSQKELSERYPSFNYVNNFEYVFEPDAGFLLPGKMIDLYVQEAITAGAVVNTNERTINWSKEGDVITVTTDKGSYSASKLIITAGAWVNKMISLSVPLRITRQLIVWVRPSSPQKFYSSNFPCWMVATHDIHGVYYGFPYLEAEQFGEPSGLKFAWHNPAEETDPDNVNRNITDEEVKDVVNRVKQYIPDVNSTIVEAKTCLYTNSPDEDFIIDHLPGHDKAVTIATGFSGHGFKFAPAMGEILAEMAMKGESSLPIEFLGLERFGRS